MIDVKLIFDRDNNHINVDYELDSVNINKFDIGILKENIEYHLLENVNTFILEKIEHKTINKLIQKIRTHIQSIIEEDGYEHNITVKNNVFNRKNNDK